MRKKRYFWLKSDNKTVVEIDDFEEIKKHLDEKRERHYIYVHRNGDIYTFKNWIPNKQFKELLRMLGYAI
jgi:hypothetical protein